MYFFKSTLLFGVLAILGASIPSVSEAKSTVTIGDVRYVCPNTCVVREVGGGLQVSDSAGGTITVIHLKGPVSVPESVPESEHDS